MRFSVPLHTDMGAAVLTHLRRLTALPARGFVAGQAVASALDDLYGAGGGVYNDVDVFVRAPAFTKPRERLVLLPTRFTPEIIMDLVPGTEYGHLPMQQTLVAAPTYTISGVRRRELLNEVFYVTAEVHGAMSSARCVLTSFDINAVRVGVDIESGQLIWDSAFARFARTSELRLCALHTPYHSLIRLLRKNRELPRVTVDIEASASLVAVLSTAEVRRSIEKNKAATFWFGAKYTEQAHVVKSELAPYFSIRTQQRYFDDVAGKVRPGYGDETAAPYELSTLKRRGEPDVEYNRFLGAEVLDLLQLPAKIYGQFAGSSRSSVVVPAAPWEAGAQPLPAVAVQMQSYGPGYLAGLPGAADMRALSKLLQPYLGVANSLQGLSAREQLALFTGVRQHLEAAGVPDVDHVLHSGVYEGVACDLTSWSQGCEKVLARERARRLGELAVPTVLDATLWSEWPDAQITLLSNERMLREWCARNGWAAPMLCGGYVWIGIHLGRHEKDASLMHFYVNGALRLLGRRQGFEKRARMPVALQPAHKKVRAQLHSFARNEGWFAPR